MTVDTELLRTYLLTGINIGTLVIGILVFVVCLGNFSWDLFRYYFSNDYYERYHPFEDKTFINYLISKKSLIYFCIFGILLQVFIKILAGLYFNSLFLK